MALAWMPGPLFTTDLRPGFGDTAGTQCPSCEHYQGLFQCAAFPERIPQEILSGEVDHRKPYPGDNGIRWKPLRSVMTFREIRKSDLAWYAFWYGKVVATGRRRLPLTRETAGNKRIGG